MCTCGAVNCWTHTRLAYFFAYDPLLLLLAVVAGTVSLLQPNTSSPPHANLKAHPVLPAAAAARYFLCHGPDVFGCSDCVSSALMCRNLTRLRHLSLSCTPVRWLWTAVEYEYKQEGKEWAGKGGG